MHAHKKNIMFYLMHCLQKSLYRNYSIESNDYKLTLREIETKGRPMAVKGFKNVRDKRIDLLDAKMDENEKYIKKIKYMETMIQQMQENNIEMKNKIESLEKNMVEVSMNK